MDALGNGYASATCGDVFFQFLDSGTRHNLLGALSGEPDLGSHATAGSLLTILASSVEEEVRTWLQDHRPESLHGRQLGELTPAGLIHWIRGNASSWAAVVDDIDAWASYGQVAAAEGADLPSSAALLEFLVELREKEDACSATFPHFSL